MTNFAGGPRDERPAGGSSYGPGGATPSTMEWVATVRVLEVELERLREALNEIARESKHWEGDLARAVLRDTPALSETEKP